MAALAGLDRECVKLAQARGGRPYRTTAEWMRRLRGLAEEMGRAPTTAEANGRGINASRLRARVGGGWEEVLREAGIDPAKRKRRVLLLSTPTEVMLGDVRRVARRLGRAPTLKEYEARGRYSGAAVRGRLGGWKRVKRLAGLRRD